MQTLTMRVSKSLRSGPGRIPTSLAASVSASLNAMTKSSGANVNFSGDEQIWWMIARCAAVTGSPGPLILSAVRNSASCC
jgi:hypothetical protein